MRSSLLFVIFATLCVISFGGLLRPRKARNPKNKLYNKDAIKAQIKLKSEPRTPAYMKAHIESHLSSSEDNQDNQDITTATDEMWASCEKRTFSQNLDHYGTGIGPNDVTTFDQRYYVCGKDLFKWQPGNPVFFYFGNEADVTAYIDYTGFMWEQAKEFNALLVFAEHRYYGESLPYTQDEIVDDTEKLKYCTTDQALNDYAILIDYLQKNTFGYGHHFAAYTEEPTRSPLIGFGGSYGGMLAAWFRMKYPHYTDGVIAASSPIWGILGLIPEADAYGFSRMETYDASTEVGVDNDLCQQNIQQGWDDIADLASTADGRSSLAEIFNLCSTPSTEDDAYSVLSVIEESIAYMAMSSYPYPSNYISGAVMGTTTGALPAYPMTHACNEHLTKEFDTSLDRVKAIGLFNAVFWNSDGQNNCINTETTWDSYTNYIWDYLWCRSLIMPSGSRGGSDDMLWDEEWDAQGSMKWCNHQYNINVDVKGPASRKYGDRDIFKAMSNIVFSNGDMDPWMPGGVTGSQESESLVNIMVEQAGHHLDLMFSNSADPQSVKDARALEIQNIQMWISQSNNNWNMGMCDIRNVQIEQQSHPWISAMNMLL